VLTAKTKVGTMICLANHPSKEPLLELRNNEEFFCPQCEEPVTLKLGDQRIFHFAHKTGSTCQEGYERETKDHLEGKLQLYQWLIQQKIPCILEYFDKEMGQRPDILFHYQGRKYALEFQCSPLPESLFIKRTKTYLEHDYIPLWIVSYHHFRPNYRSTVPLTNFHYLFLRASESGQFFIPAYCPKTKKFHIVTSIIPYSVKNAFVLRSCFPLDRTPLHDILQPPKNSNQLKFSCWTREVENYTYKWALHTGAGKDPFLQYLYKHNLNLFLLPPEIGLPVKHSFYFYSSPIVWQTYFFLDHIANRNLGDFISLQELICQVKKRISTKEIMLRHLPQLEGVDPMIPVIEYFRQLIGLGILTRVNAGLCQVNREIGIPRSNSEKEEAKRLFYQKYRNLY
jgi:competence protein CoiA